MRHSQFHYIEAYTETCMAYSLRQAYDYWQDQPGLLMTASQRCRVHQRAQAWKPSCAFQARFVQLISQLQIALHFLFDTNGASFPVVSLRASPKVREFDNADILWSHRSSHQNYTILRMSTSAWTGLYTVLPANAAKTQPALTTTSWRNFFTTPK